MQAKYCHITTVCVCACVPMYKYMHVRVLQGGRSNDIIIAGILSSDMHTHAHYVLYSQAYFTGLIFAVRLYIIHENWIS